MRVIARLNIGGPSIQAISLSRLLEPLGYDTLLVRGAEGPREGSMDDLARRLDVHPHRLRGLRRELGHHDLRAVAGMLRLLRGYRPDILHTHAAKAGTVGRIAALLAGRARPPVVVHTFHGHTLSGYFSPPTSWIYTQVERALAISTTRLVAVSDEVREDLVGLSVAPQDRMEVIPLGFDLSGFESVDEEPERGRAVRRKLGIPQGSHVVTLVARLVAIKRVDRFLRVACRLKDIPNVRFVVVGDGELHRALSSSPSAIALAGLLTWAGFQSDIQAVMAASDVVVQTSDNEGTPVSLIEAQAAGVPVVSTRVGGVASVVLEGRSGRLVEPDDEEGFAEAIRGLILDRARAAAYGQAGRKHVLERFSQARLVEDVDRLYRRLLAERGTVSSRPRKRP